MSATNETILGAAPPPDDVTPNFTDPDSIGYRLVIVAVFFPCLCLPFLGARLWSASFVLKCWHRDDFWIIIAFLTAVTNSIICSIQTHYGLGNHIWDVSVDDFGKFLKLGVIGGHMTYNLTTLFTKISILSFYLRFSIEPAFKVAVYAVMLVAVGYTIPNSLLWTYICRPMRSYWDLSVQGTCVNMDASFHTSNALNVVTDFAILLLPIWMLKPLRIPFMKKIGIMLILMAGGFVCAVSTMRMIRALLGLGNLDTTWHYTENLIWCLVEMYVGIICACLPCLRAFVKRYFPNLFVFDDAFEHRLTSFRLTAPLTHQGASNLTAVPAREDSETTTIAGNATLRAKPSQGSEFAINSTQSSEENTLHDGEKR